MKDLKDLDKKNLEDVFALTPLQEGMLFHYRQNPAGDRYIEQLTLEISGEIETVTFKKAWDVVVETNEMLRTIFRWEKIKHPLQVVLKKYDLKPIYHDLSGIKTSEKSRLAEEIKINDRKKKFDLREIPFRVTLCKIEENRYQLIVSNHHILYDGWSNGIILREFFNVYNDLAHQQTPMKPVKNKFKEYIKWLKTREKNKQEKFWREYLEGVENHTELAVKTRKTKDFFDENEVKPGFQRKEKPQVRLSRHHKNLIEEFIKKHKITLAALFYTTWGILLQRYNNSSDVLFGTTVSGRSARLNGIEEMVGLFINTLPLRVKSNPGETVTDVLNQVNHMLQNREKYEASSLVDISTYSQLGNGRELFDSLVVMENYPLESQLMMENRNLSIDSYSMVETTHYDLTVGIVIFDGIEIDFVYNRECFEPGIIKNLSDHFYRILENIIKKPTQQVHEIEILSEEEKQRLLVDFNDTAADYPRDKTIHQWFAEQAEQTPGYIALVGRSEGTRGLAPWPALISTTYQELNHQSDRLAGVLLEKGVKPDTIVGIMIERSIEMIIGILGILKAGGAYLPIDPDYPEERITYILKDSDTRILLKGNSVGAEKSETIPNDQNANDKNSTTTCLVLNFEHLIFEFVSNFEFRASNLNPSNLAYVIYTSGTTGKPKGVMTEHLNVIAYVNAFYTEFKITPNDIFLQQASFSFDAFAEEVYPILLKGGKLVVCPKDVVINLDRFFKFLAKQHITMISCSPLLMAEINNRDNLTTLGNIHTFISGGDILKKEYVNNLLKVGNVYNTYGPTETTVCATYYQCSPADTRNVPIGNPISNYNIYIVDKDNHLQPQGVPGELCIGGAGVARGYLNQPQLTAEKFCLRRPGGSFCKNRPLDPHKNFPLHTSHKSYMSYISYIYHTGDLARWLPDNNIEFLGRIDHQVKIRGFRIELGEIESLLTTHPQIKDAVVIDREDKKGDKYLAAYIVHHNTSRDPYNYDTVSTENLQEFLVQKLPDYMIPTYFIPIEHVPLTPTGKKDRKTLPEPGVKIHQEYTPPNNPVEEKLVQIWQEVLRIEKIGVNDNFFKRGGHSLKAAVLVSRISRDFHVEFPLGQVFANPTVKSLARFINLAKTSIYEVIKPVEKKKYYPLSSTQQRLFFLNQLGNTGTTYNMPAVVTHPGSIDKTRIVNTVETLIKRHENLRTSFEFIDNIPAQRIHDEVEFKIEYYDKKEVEVEESTGEGRVEEKRAKSCIDSFIRPFDLTRPPLLRVGLAEISNQENLLLFDMHHTISDGTSIAILTREFTSLYDGENLPPLKIQYKDFCLWQKNKLETGAIRSQENYWLSLYRGEIPGLNLPTDYPRPQVMTFEGDEYEFKLNPGETRRFNALASAPDVTLFMNLMAVFNVLLYKYSGQEDIIVGSGLSGRAHADLQAAIGMFVNVLPMRHHPEGEKTYLEFLAEIKESGIKAHENQDFPFEELVDKLKPGIDLSRNPLFDVCLMVQNFDTPTDKPINLTINTENIYHKVSRFDLTLFAEEKGEEIVFQLEYSTKLFKAETIQRLVDHFLNIIRQVSVNPGIRISDLDILTTAEKQQVLYDFNDTAALYPRDKVIHQFFQEQAEQRPDCIALVGTHESRFEGTGGLAPLSVPISITYRELNEKSGYLAHLLKEKGVGPDTIVGIMVERSAAMVIGILGILKSGGAYLPIDPAHPKDRIDYILSDSSVGLLLTTLKFQAKVKNKIEVEGDYRQPRQQRMQLIDIETALASALASLPSTSTCQVSTANRAYVLYTSGSSGRPKGVVVEHGSLMNVLTALNRYYPFDETCVYLMKTSYEFDVSAAELFGWFLGGGVLAILQKYGEKDPQQILAAAARYGITHINFVPSMFRAFIDLLNRENIIGISRLKYIFLAGEALPGELVHRFTRLNPGIRLENIYGPTEAAIYASKYSLLEWQGGDAVPIGKPLPNVKLYIFDCQGHWQGIGIPGELGIAGAGLARGYLNKPELTAQKFPPVSPRYYRSHLSHMSNRSYLSYIPQKIYKTGDLARWLPDGNIEYLGRIDNQVKIRGFRIEPGEIERRLLTHQGISDAVVVSRQDQPGDQIYLCAYFVPRGGLSGDGLHEYLTGSLPGYMIPSYFVPLPKIPLTPSGKVDRKSLPAPGVFQRHSKAVYVPCASDTEKLIEGIWKNVLKLEKIGIDDNFFNIGGNSINVLQVNNRLNDVLSSRLTVIEMFRYTTIRSLAQFLSQQGIERDIDRKKWADTFKRSKIDIKQIYQKRKENEKIKPGRNFYEREKTVG